MWEGSVGALVGVQKEMEGVHKIGLFKVEFNEKLL